MTEYEMLKNVNAVRVTKNGQYDRRYKATRQIEDNSKGVEAFHRVSQEKRKDTRVIAETKKRKRVQRIKKTSFLDKVTGFFKVLFILAIVIAIPLSYAIAER